MNYNLGCNQKSILYELDKKPFFIDDFRKKYPTNNNKCILRQLRSLKQRGYNLCWFRYKGHKNTGKRIKHKIDNFLLVYFFEDRKLAWELLLEKHPNVNKNQRKWVCFGKPILRNLVGRFAKGGCKMVKEDINEL